MNRNEAIFRTEGTAALKPSYESRHQAAIIEFQDISPKRTHQPEPGFIESALNLAKSRIAGDPLLGSIAGSLDDSKSMKITRAERRLVAKAMAATFVVAIAMIVVVA